MDIQDKLIELSQYGVNFNVANGKFVIKIKYNDKWTVIQPEKTDIEFYRDENDDTVYYYVAPISVAIENIFSAIDETIEYNRELELKIVLFKEKMNELQELFAKEPLEVLNTLEFRVRKRKEKAKKEPVQVKEEQPKTVKKTVRKKNTEKKKTYIKPEEEQNTEVCEIDEKISEVLNS